MARRVAGCEIGELDLSSSGQRGYVAARRLCSSFRRPFMVTRGGRSAGGTPTAGTALYFGICLLYQHFHVSRGYVAARLLCFSFDHPFMLLVQEGVHVERQQQERQCILDFVSRINISTVQGVTWLLVASALYSVALSSLFVEGEVQEERLQQDRHCCILYVLLVSSLPRLKVDTGEHM